MGQVKDALILASSSHQINGWESKTNYLLGLLHLHLSNYSVAVRHFDRAIRAEPDLATEIENYKLTAACLDSEKEASQHLQCQGVITIELKMT